MKNLSQASLINRGVETELIGHTRSVGLAACNRELSYCRLTKLLVS